MSLAVGSLIPDLTLPASGGRMIALRGTGRKQVLYFYPKDSTPGCTLEGQDFRDRYMEFQAAGCEVLGVSRDSVKSHDNFVAKQCFPFPLLSDADGAACEAFGTWIEKSMYGRKYMGIERATFLFDAQGRLAQVWNSVKVKGHAADVLAAAQKL